MMKKMLLTAVAVVLLGCDDDDPWPDLVIPSSSVDEGLVHMAVYAQTDGEETDVTVYLHRHHGRGHTQYLNLSGSDRLSVGHGDWSADMEARLAPTEDDPLLVFYNDVLNIDQPNQQFTVDFLRNETSLLSGVGSLLNETEFSFTADAEPAGLESVLTASWTALEDYRYRLKIRFQCDTAEDGKVGFSLSYPQSNSDELVSPITVDMGEFQAPPAGSQNCTATAKLIAEADQTPESDADEPINVFVARAHTQSVALVIE